MPYSLSTVILNFQNCVGTKFFSESTWETNWKRWKFQTIWLSVREKTTHGIFLTFEKFRKTRIEQNISVKPKKSFRKKKTKIDVHFSDRSLASLPISGRQSVIEKHYARSGPKSNFETIKNLGKNHVIGILGMTFGLVFKKIYLETVMTIDVVHFCRHRRLGGKSLRMRITLQTIYTPFLKHRKIFEGNFCG